MLQFCIAQRKNNVFKVNASNILDKPKGDTNAVMLITEYQQQQLNFRITVAFLLFLNSSYPLSPLDFLFHNQLPKATLNLWLQGHPLFVKEILWLASLLVSGRLDFYNTGWVESNCCFQQEDNYSHWKLHPVIFLFCWYTWDVGG